MKFSKYIHFIEYFHFTEYDVRIIGTNNDVDCPAIQANEYVPLEDWDQEIDHIGGSDERQEIYFAGSDKPAYIISQRISVNRQDTGELGSDRAEQVVEVIPQPDEIDGMFR
jgi:hypothetical protein